MVFSAAFFASCSEVNLGPATINDPAPSGSLVYQGNFASFNGRTVTGEVSVYQGSCSATLICNFTVRLQSLSAPADSGLQVVPTINGVSPTATFTLRASTGNQNYYYSEIPSAAVWTTISIYSATENTHFGIANLNKVQ